MPLTPLYPPIEPYETGMLDVGDGHQIYWEQCGNPKGTPIVFLHGGPGSGCAPWQRQLFNPEKYCITLFDQRGAGRSLPHACTDHNTTQHLISDIEKLREYLEIDTWHVSGGSWGSTLALAYTMEHAKNVNSLALYGIFLARQEELTDLYFDGGVASKIYPDVFENYLNFLPDDKRNNPLHGYREIFLSDDKEQRLKALNMWTHLEKKISRLVVTSELLNQEMADPDFVLAFATIENHYFLSNGFIDGDEILAQIAEKIGNKPVHIIQGRYDMVCPFKTAWDLHKSLPHSHLHIVDEAGHTAKAPAMASQFINVLDIL